MREQYRRLLRCFPRLDASNDDFERIEYVSTLCDELRQLVALECSVLHPNLNDALPDQFAIGTDAHSRRSELIALAGELESLALDAPRFGAVVDKAFNCSVTHVQRALRELLPYLETMRRNPAERLAEELLSLKERMAEH